jgi:hypothetical protein
MSTEALEVIGEDTEVAYIEPGAVGAIVKSEVEAQLDAAHKYRRSIKLFLDEAITLATFSEDIAKSCIYSLPRGKDDSGNKKIITGPSVRLAEMVMSAYGNMHVGARVVAIEEKEIVAQGIAWDLEKNLRVTIEKRRRITDKNGRRFKDDMITVTGNAAASIGLRDAVFRVVPRAYVNAIYDRAREVAVGTAKTLTDKRARMFDGFMKLGVPKERVLMRIEKTGIEDVSLTDMELLIGLANAIKDGNLQIDDAFPPNGERTRGTIDLDSLREGKEENRGHGKENMGSAAPNPGPGAEQQRQPSKEPAPAAADIVTPDEWRDMETFAKDCKVRMSAVVEHIMDTMGVRPAESLPKARLKEVMNWLAAKAK